MPLHLIQVSVVGWCNFSFLTVIDISVQSLACVVKCVTVEQAAPPALTVSV